MTNCYRRNSKDGPSELLLWAVRRKHEKGEPTKAIAHDLGIAKRTMQSWVSRKCEEDEVIG